MEDMMNTTENINTFPGRTANSVFTWELDEDGILEISGKGRMSDFGRGKLPEVPWAELRDQIIEVVLSENITEIGGRAFENCTSLERVFLPESLKAINSRAFAGCTNLEELITSDEAAYVSKVMPKELRDESEKIENIRKITLGDHAFAGTKWGLEKWGEFFVREGVLIEYLGTEKVIDIDSSVRVIERFAFLDCPITEVKFPEGVKEICEFSFAGTEISEIELPESVERVAQGAFSDCENLSRVCVNGANTEINDGAFLDSKLSYSGKISPLYKLTSKQDKAYPKFKRMMVRRDTTSKVLQSISNAGTSLVSRIKRKALVYSVVSDSENRKVEAVYLYALGENKSEILKTNVQQEADTVAMSQDEFENALNKSFVSAKDAIVTEYNQNGKTIEWFAADEKEDCDGTSLLQCWLNDHRGYTVL